MNNKVSAVIAAAGSGSRMNTEKCKQILELDNKPIIHYSILAFEIADNVDEIIIISNDKIFNEIVELVKKYSYKKVASIVKGGAERQDSVSNALQELKTLPPEIVLIHDAVRPFITVPLIDRVIDAARTFDSAVPGIRLKDTIKLTRDGIYFDETPDRNMYRLIQTPQGFNFDLLLRAYDSAYKEGFYGTDDASLMERIGVKPFIIDGDEKNLKITTQSDLKVADLMIKDFNYMK